MEIATVGYDPEKGWSHPLPDWDSAQTLVLAFGASSLSSRTLPFTDLGRRYPTALCVGCSTSGEILETKVSDGGLAVAVVRFNDTRLRAAWTSIPAMDQSRLKGTTLAHDLDAPDLRGVLVLSDGLHVNGSQLTQGLNDVFQGRVVVTGGLAGDRTRFQSTWVLRDGLPQEGCICAVGFYGDAIRIGHGSQGGWDRFGPDRKVTRSKDNVLFELDGVPALEIYKHALGPLAAELPASGLLFPLALRATAGDARELVRTVLAVDEGQSSLTFAGDLPEGSSVRFMRANFDRLIGGAKDAAERVQASGDGPALSVAISCVGRRLVLGERTEEEVKATLKVLPPGTHQVGFYSYGEISPYSTGTCDLHNQTMTLTLLQEA